jgi:hypothetical protein
MEKKKDTVKGNIKSESLFKYGRNLPLLGVLGVLLLRLM